MKSLIAYIQFVLVALFCITGAQAATSDWQDLGGGEARLLATLDPETGKLNAALEVKLKPGWSTYWRYPGSSGIPPLFDFSATDGFEVETVEYPAPTLLGDKHLRYAGYKKHVVFPISGKFYPGIKPAVKLDVLIGICANVCIPARAEMKIDTNELMRSDPLTGQSIKLARLSVPKQVAADTVVRTVEMLDDRTLVITVAHKNPNQVPALFVEGPKEWLMEPAKLLERSNGNAKFAVDLSWAPKPLDVTKHKLKYTLVSGSTGIEFVR